MAQNRIPNRYAPLVSLGEDAADGADLHGTALGLAHHPAAKIRADLFALAGNPAATPPLVGRQDALNTAKAAKTAATAGERAAVEQARTFVRTAISVLRPQLGSTWNSAWVATGLTGGSLAVPDDPLPLLRALAGFFSIHEELTVPSLGLTAGGCTTTAETVSTARSNAHAALQALATAKQARDAAQEALYRRLSGLRGELEQVLGADDPRWYAFGFERPADGEQPGPVKHLAVAAGGPGIVIADWDAAPRAERYRIRRQVQGEDAAPVVLELAPRDSEVTLTGLPSGKEVLIAVAAVNDSGEGPEAQATLRVP